MIRCSADSSNISWLGSGRRKFHKGGKQPNHQWPYPKEAALFSCLAMTLATRARGSTVRQLPPAPRDIAVTWLAGVTDASFGYGRSCSEAFAYSLPWHDTENATCTGRTIVLSTSCAILNADKSTASFCSFLLWSWHVCAGSALSLILHAHVPTFRDTGAICYGV